MLRNRKNIKILIVDDEPSIVKIIETALKKNGFSTLSANSGKQALKILEQNKINLVLLDLRLGHGINGFQTMQKIHEITPDLPIIMITAYGNIEVAVQAIKSGASEFICKPFSIKELNDSVEKVLEDAFNSEINNRGATEEFLETGCRLHFGTIIGESQPMQKVYELIKKSAPVNETIIIEGESGTGKELAAKAIHTHSKRCQHPWVALNCAAIPENLLESEMFGHVAGAFTGASYEREGLFLSANHGTLFLDEIGVMDLQLQGKLLRALQEGKIRRIGENKDISIDTRIVAATNNRLEELVKTGLFREDLYYRINVIPIRMPPLRERWSDIPLLAKAFCHHQSSKLNQEIALDDETLDALRLYKWPGNVREMQNAIACAAVLSHQGKITIDTLPPRIRAAEKDSVASLDSEAETKNINISEISLKDFLKFKEKQYISKVLEKTGGNRARAADLLGISRATFYRRYENYIQE